MKLALTAVMVLAGLPTANALAQVLPDTLRLTLEQSEELAFQNNLIVRDAQLGVATFEAKLRQASNAKYLPRFTVRNLWGPSTKAEGVVDSITGFVTSPDTAFSGSDLRYFTQVDLDLVQPIYTFGKLSSLSEAAEHGVEAANYRLETEHAKVRFQVRQLYWAMLLGEELLAIIRSAEAELTDAEEKVAEKLDEGSEEVSQTDVFKLEVFRYEINKRLREAENTISLTAAAFKKTLGVDDDVIIATAAEFLDPVTITVDSLPTYLGLAARNRPEVGGLQAALRAKEAQIRLEASDYYPQFFVAGQIRYNFAKDRFDPRNPFLYNPTNYFRPGIAVGVNMNLNFWQTRDKVRVARSEFFQLAHKEQLLLDGVELEVQKEYLALRKAESDMEDSRAAARATTSWLRSASMTFDIGVGEVKDLIDAFKANSEMQAEHLRNVFNYNVAAAKLSQVIGGDIFGN